MFIEANPQYKSINVCDANMQPVKELGKKEGQEVPAAVTGEWTKPEKTQANKQVDKPSQQPLLQRIRTGRGKGMHP
jgi:hypothetical protein